MALDDIPDPPPPKKARFRLGARLFWVALVTALVMGWVILPGRTLPLPDFLVVQIEQRLNQTLRRSLADVSLSVQGVTLALGDDYVPELKLSDLRLVNDEGAAILTLPEVALRLAPRPMLQGNLRPRTLRLIGARIEVTRNAAGKLNMAFASAPDQAPNATLSLHDLFALSDRILASPLAENLTDIRAEDLALHLSDQRSGQDWRLGNGALDIRTMNGAFAADLTLALQSAASPGQLALSVIAPKDTDEARITARLDNVAAADLATQIAPLAFVGLLNAPLSGQVSTTVTPDGISALTADFSFGKGVLQPSPSANPIAFDTARMALGYDPDKGRVNLTDMQVKSSILQIKATGHGDMLRADGSPIAGVITGEVPDAFVVQLQISQVRVDRPELFTAPVIFDAGAVDMRLRLLPFAVDLGQLSLSGGGTRILARGSASAGGAGWLAALDMQINQISGAELLGIWPRTLIKGTRDWLDHNMLAGQMSDIKAALRIAQDQQPVIALGFDYQDAVMRVMKSLPPIEKAAGYGAISNNVLTLVLEHGQTTPPLGGVVDLSGSVFRIKDIRQIPGQAEITLQARAPLTATLSLLDEKPFRYLTKAGRAVTLGQGHAQVVAQIAMTLKKVILPTDVTVKVTGHVYDFSSDVLVPGRRVTSRDLSVDFDKMALRIAGQGQLAGVEYDAVFTQKMGAAHKGRSQISGSLALSDAGLRAFGIALPDGAVTGLGRAEVVVDLVQGQAPELTLTSDLNRIGLDIPGLGWSKPAATRGKLALSATLSAPAVVDDFTLSAQDLTATGRITLKRGGGLDVASFARVTFGKWLDGRLDILGKDKGIAVLVKGGNVDLRYLPKARQANAGPAIPMALHLDQLRVSDGIILTQMDGSFQLGAAMTGNFLAKVGGGPEIQGALAAAPHGTQVRVTAQDAGAVMAAAGIYASARGGGMNLTLTPRAAAGATKGTYDGAVAITRLRVQNASVLAELLNAVSVVGLLDQLGGAGILFNNVRGRFTLGPMGVEVQEGAATGASLGVTMRGIYRAATRALDMQGTISPVYMLNGIGEVIARRGEGVVGFNYALKGGADDPKVSVDLLSVLTPGFLRDVFRRPTPKLNEGN